MQRLGDPVSTVSIVLVILPSLAWRATDDLAGAGLGQRTVHLHVFHSCEPLVSPRSNVQTDHHCTIIIRTVAVAEL